MLRDLKWHTKKFNELTTNELYDILKLRIDVFVVEQTCYYADLDDYDRHTDALHCFAYYISPKNNQTLVAYARILPKQTTYADYISIGRVVTSPVYRGNKIGYALIEQTIDACELNFSNESIKISAQEHLQTFYKHYGFVTVSEMYLEDNIPHISMLRQ